MHVAGIILAGGLSRRMGREKALLMLKDRPLVDRVVARLRPQVSGLTLNANGDASRFEFLGLPVIADGTDQIGPLGGMLAGLQWAAAQGFDHVVTVPVDTPFVPRDLVGVLTSSAPAQVVMARSGGRPHPVVGLWSVTLRDDLGAFLASDRRRSVMAFAERYPVAYVDFPPIALADGAVADPFFNINRPEDLGSAEEIAAEIEP